MRIRFHVISDNPKARLAERDLTAECNRLGLQAVSEGATDCVIALGGDGTLLHAVDAFPGVPVLGFNLGGLGYLSHVEERHFNEALKRLAQGEFRIENHTMLKAQIGARSVLALNDIVVRGLSGHATVLDVSCDEHAPTRYLADGLIIATPTGSTAYSLSAGGPVLTTDSASFVLTPMNPHALGIRPIVLSDSVQLAVQTSPRCNHPAEKVGVYADGKNAFYLDEGDILTVVKADHMTPFVELEGYDPYEVLSRKLGWSGTVVK